MYRIFVIPCLIKLACYNDNNLVIQDTLGHKDISTTMNIYADVTKELKTEEFKELDMYLKKDQ